MTTEDNQLAHSLRGLTAYPDRVVAVVREQGWRPPARVITTAKKLDALPPGSIGRSDKHGVAFQRTERGWDEPGAWVGARLRRSVSSEEVLTLGAFTVLWTPEEQSR